MEFILYKGKKLIYIKNIADLIDEQGKAKYDLFNSEGAMLTLKGKVPRDKIFHVSVYTYQDVYEELSLKGKNKDSQMDSPADAAKRSAEQIKSELSKNLGQNIVNMYSEVNKSVIQLINGEPITPKKVQTANELIHESLKQDKVKLHTCISQLRTVDTFTYDHSFSVALLMTQALEDFRDCKDSDQYWDAFKTISGKVNFTKTGIQNYGVGALLHDYGKTLIPKEILNKPGELTTDEFQIMKQHPFLGVEAIKKAGIEDPQIIEIVGNHHAGYLTFRERGQSALALICNIVDIYDACRSKRVYKDPFPMEAVEDILKKESIRYKWNNFIFTIIVHQTLAKFESHRKELIEKIHVKTQGI